MFVIPLDFFISHPEFVSSLSEALKSQSVFYAYESDIEELDLDEKNHLLEVVSSLERFHES